MKDNRVVKFDKYSMLEMFPTNVEDPPQWIMYYDAYDAGINEGEIVYNLSIIQTYSGLWMWHRIIIT